MEIQEQRPGTFSVIVKMGNPVFIVLAVVLPIAALVTAMALGSLALLSYVHIMAGVLWAGIGLFLGWVLGPVLGAMEPRQKAEVIKRLIPKLTFLMPTVAGVTIVAGVKLAQDLGMLTFDNLWIVCALVITAILAIPAFGVMVPNDIRIFKQLISPMPDIDRIVKLGMQNHKLARIQGLLQLTVIFVMANIRF